MSVSKDLLFQNFSTVGDDQQLGDVQTIASAADIGALIGFLTIITGTTAITTITPPTTGWALVCLVFTDVNPGGVTTGGNIANTVDPAQYVPVFLIWNPIAKTWYAK